VLRIRVPHNYGEPQSRAVHYSDLCHFVCTEMLRIDNKACDEERNFREGCDSSPADPMHAQIEHVAYILDHTGEGVPP
jgi:hypothetical protein